MFIIKVPGFRDFFWFNLNFPFVFLFAGKLKTFGINIKQYPERYFDFYCRDVRRYVSTFPIPGLLFTLCRTSLNLIYFTFLHSSNRRVISKNQNKSPKTYRIQAFELFGLILIILPYNDRTFLCTVLCIFPSPPFF